MSHAKPQLKPGVATRRDGRVEVDTAWQPVGVTAQFLENAATYHARYFQNGYWKYLVGRGLDAIDQPRAARLDVLDIGSGSGNSVFAALELLPNARVIANDISPQLLQILLGIQDTIPALTGRLDAYCFDLAKDFFADACFDLAIGGSILHHMLDPAAALRNVAKWLRPGGKILLFEPLEIGAHMMAAIYLSLIDALSQCPDLDPRLLPFFKAMCHDYEARFGIPRVKPWTEHLDDKWLFHPAYLRDMAASIGLTLHSITPTTDDPTHLFQNAVRGTLSVAGLGDMPTPDQLWDTLAAFDGGINASLKHRFAPEGIIVLAKP